jgi:hypothetical protein
MKCESTIKHSQFSKKIRSYITTLIFITLFWGFWALQAQAQMFSVGNSGPRFNIPQTEVYAGIQPMEVTYQGSSSITLGQGRNAFNFEGPIIRLGYESPTLDLFLGTGGQISGIDGASYFDIGGNIDFGLSVLRTEALSIQIPFRIASRFTNITSDQAFQAPGVERFRFGSLTAGAGARILGRPFDNFRIEAGAIPSYGFSFASGGFFGGSMSSVAGFGRLYFDRLFEDVGISVGYKYDYRNYDVDEDIYDYKMKGHSLELGITF